MQYVFLQAIIYIDLVTGYPPNPPPPPIDIPSPPPPSADNFFRATPPTGHFPIGHFTQGQFPPGQFPPVYYYTCITSMLSPYASHVRYDNDDCNNYVEQCVHLFELLKRFHINLINLLS